MRWEIMLYAMDHGISHDEAIKALAEECVDFFEAVL